MLCRPVNAGLAALHRERESAYVSPTYADKRNEFSKGQVHVPSTVYRLLQYQFRGTFTFLWISRPSMQHRKTKREHHFVFLLVTLDRRILLASEGESNDSIRHPQRSRHGLIAKAMKTCGPRNSVSTAVDIAEARQGKAGDAALSTSATLGHLVGGCAFRGGPEQLGRMLHRTDQKWTRI